MPNRKETDSTVIRTRDLLYRYLEFQRLAPHKHNWSASAMAGDPPRLIRYQRLVAILGALGIQTDLASFDEGAFIDVNNPAYEPLLSRARNELSESHVRTMNRRTGKDSRSPRSVTHSLSGKAGRSDRRPRRAVRGSLQRSL